MSAIRRTPVDEAERIVRAASRRLEHSRREGAKRLAEVLVAVGILVWLWWHLVDDLTTLAARILVALP